MRARFLVRLAGTACALATAASTLLLPFSALAQTPDAQARAKLAPDLLTTAAAVLLAARSGFEASGVGVAALDSRIDYSQRTLAGKGLAARGWVRGGDRSADCAAHTRRHQADVAAVIGCIDWAIQHPHRQPLTV